MGSLRLDKALLHGELRDVLLTAGDYVLSPPKNYCWLILSGRITHTTGTATVIAVSRKGKRVWQTEVLAAVASGSYPLFQTQGEEETSQWSPIFLDDDSTLGRLAGGTNAEILVTVLEWMP